MSPQRYSFLGMVLQKCRVAGVFVAVGAGGAAPAVLLSQNGEDCLPIYIGLWEAISINSAINGDVPPRPLTHDLFIEFLNRFGITLRGLSIDSLEEGVFYGNLILASDHHEESMDCRPSDGIALAIRCNAEIMVESSVLEGSKVSRETLSNLVDLNSYLFG